MDPPSHIGESQSAPIAKDTEGYHGGSHQTRKPQQNTSTITRITTMVQKVLARESGQTGQNWKWASLASFGGGPGCCSVTRGRGRAWRAKIYIYFYIWYRFFDLSHSVITFSMTLRSNLSLTRALTKEMRCSRDLRVSMRCTGLTVSS